MAGWVLEDVAGMEPDTFLSPTSISLMRTASKHLALDGWTPICCTME
jgi:hypothetical protein